MGGIAFALALATLVEDREDMVVPFASVCMHACLLCMECEYYFLYLLYTFAIRNESCVSFILFSLKETLSYTCCDVGQREEGVHRYCVCVDNLGRLLCLVLKK